MELENEVQALADFVAPILPLVKINMQYVPELYEAKTISIEFEKGSSQDETSSHYRLDRLYQIVYFGANPRECLSAMSKLEKKIKNETRTLINTPIPGDPLKRAITDSMRFGPFSVSKPIKSENGVYFSIGMLQASIRELRTVEEAVKIGEVIIVANDILNKSKCQPE